MNPFRCICLSIICCFFLNADSPDKATWELQRNEQGIMVYTRPHAGTTIKEIRVVNTVKTSLSAFTAFLIDTKNYPSWIYSCKEARTLKTVSPLEIFQYNVTSVPIPFHNRDLIVELSISQDPKTKIITTESISKPDFMPTIDGMERIKEYYSHYKVTPLDSGFVKIEMEMFVEPGGNIPNWLINVTIEKGPFSTTVAMTEELKKPQYQNVRFPTINEMK
jgi:hypothetical protein